MKTKPLFRAIVWCLIWNSALIAISSFLTIGGIQLRRVTVATFENELADQKKYAMKYALPEAQAKAYLSSIVALEKYLGLLEEARTLPFSIGLTVLVISCCTEAGLILILLRVKREAKTMGPSASVAPVTPTAT